MARKSSGSKRSAMKASTSSGYRHAVRNGHAFNNEPAFKKARRQCEGGWRSMSDGRLLKDARKRAEYEAWRIIYGQTTKKG